MGQDAARAAARVELWSGRVAWARSLLPTPSCPRDCFLALASAAILVVVASGWLWSAYLGSRDTAFAEAAARLELVANLAAYEARHVTGGEFPTREHLERLAATLPGMALARGRTIYLADQQGFIVASTIQSGRAPHALPALFRHGAMHGLTANDSVVDARLSDGTPVIAAVRNIGSGHIALVQPHAALAPAPGLLYALPLGALAVAFGVAGFGVQGWRHHNDGRARPADATRLTAALDMAHAGGRCGAWDWDIARGRVFLSAPLYDLLGYRRRGHDLSIDELEAIFHPQNGTFKALAEAVAASGETRLHREIRARAADGSWLWLKLSAEWVVDPIDRSRHLVGLATDVTRERGESERRAFENTRLREAVEAISEAFVLWDGDDRLVLCNSKFLNLHGIAPEDAVAGAPASSVLAFGRQPAIERERPASLSDDRASRTTEIQLDDGRWFHINERRTGDGGTVSVGIDVSVLKRKEARLRERERRLQGSVRAAETAAQRYAALAERNHEANLAKTEFLARMSHELRTPLNHIIGFADMMQQELLGPHACARYHEYSRDIHRSGNDLLGKIDGILQMARLESGQVALSPVLTCVETILHGACSDVAADAAAKDVRLDLGAEASSATMLQADEAALREILVRLLENAVKFNRRGGSVRVRVRRAYSGVNVYVADTGVGIPDHVLPQLGRPFEQVESEYSRAAGGSGSGLPIAFALAELHGGRLRIRSQLGAGTVVMLHLPTTQPAANDIEADGIEARRPAFRLLAAE